MRSLITRDFWDSDIMSHYVRCPGGYLGVRPFTLYSAIGFDILRNLGLDKECYIHHVNIKKNFTIIITEHHCMSVTHDKSKSFVDIRWKIGISRIHNLSTIDNNQVAIYSTEDHSEIPFIIECDDNEKLKSVLLAIEYAIMLTLPYSSSTYTIE